MLIASAVVATFALTSGYSAASPYAHSYQCNGLLSHQICHLLQQVVVEFYGVPAVVVAVAVVVVHVDSPMLS